VHATSGHFILVTGASTGIGRASTLALLEAGFSVFACVRNERAGATLRSQAPASAVDRLHTLELDVTRPDQIRSAVAAVTRTVGERGLWGLYNNAGIAVNGPIESLPIDELRRQIEVNVIGQVAVTQAFIPELRRARGRILITGSIAGFFTAPGLGPYSISKHAMEALGDALRRELRPWGIQVSLLEPGAIATEIWRKGTSEVDAIRRDAPPGLLENYAGLIESLHGLAMLSARQASPVAVVTRAVVHAFTSPRPRTRYRMGKDSSARKWLSRLPDRWVDALIARVFRWG
jgi:NAD(P)-dependent dehydrogenase (short-subunit alcohol dehydrogenase family)